MNLLPLFYLFKKAFKEVKKLTKFIFKIDKICEHGK